MYELIKSQGLFIVLCAGFGIYAVYYLWNAFKFARGYVIARHKYYEKYGKDSAQHINQFWGWVILFGGFCIFCIYSVITVDPTIEQLQWFRMAYAIVALILFGQMVIAIVKRSALVGPEAIVLESNVIPWKSVLALEPKKRGVQRVVDVVTTQGTFTVSREMGLLLHDEYEKYRKAKKEKKEKKGK